jgi:Methyltransferase domain
MIATMGWIATHVDRRTRIYETGCGCAANLIWLGQHGFGSLSGSDISAEAIVAARKLVALAELPITLVQDDALAPQVPIAPMGLLLALNWVYLCDSFDLAHFLTLYRDRLVPTGFIVFDMVDEAFDRMPDNQYLTDDWPLPAECRRPTQYKSRMARDEVTKTAAAAGFSVVTMLPASEVPPRFVTVLQRR